jgi:adenylate cyclase
MVREKIRLLVLLIALCLSILSADFFPEIIRPLDNALNDWRVRISVRIAQWHAEKNHLDLKERRFVIIDIDERSVLEQGPWPWSREKIAEMMKILLDEYAVSGLALDIVFPEEKTSDNLLAQQIQRPEVTGAVVYDLLNRQLPALTHLPDFAESMTFSNGIPLAFGVPVTSNNPKVLPGRLGHITPLIDEDGTIRRLPPVICSKDGSKNCRPLLEIVAFSGLMSDIRYEFHRGSGWLKPYWEMWLKDGADAIVAKVPLNRDGTIAIPYRHDVDSWLAIAATDILNRKVDSRVIKGSIALVGSTALGTSDVISTPIKEVASGIEPHAEVLSALFDNHFPYMPKYSQLFTLLLLLPFSVLLFGMLKAIRSALVTTLIYPMWALFSLLAGFSIAVSIFWQFQIILPLSSFLIFPFLTIVFCLLFELHKSFGDKVSVIGLLAAYVPKQVASRLALTDRKRNAIDTNIDASRREISVLFADIRGFTGLVERCKPEVIASLMQRIFTEMADSVVQHHGTIDKFIGDAVMAFWNAPDDDPLHAQHACAAAQEIVARIQGLGDFCRELGIEPISIGIGVETGFALVGNFGSEHRRTYTALGETVVLASRIEGLTAQYAKNILVGENCAQKLGVEYFDYLGEAAIRGRQKTVSVYSPLE